MTSNQIIIIVLVVAVIAIIVAAFARSGPRVTVIDTRPNRDDEGTPQQ